MLYCMKCRKYAYKTHPCPINSLIPLKKECRGIADKMHSLGLELLSAAWFVCPVQDSTYEHTIIIDIELQRTSPETLLPTLPKNWKWYTQTVTGEHLHLSVLGYSEQFVFLGVETIKERIKQIIDKFISYLDTRDPESFRAILTLMYSWYITTMLKLQMQPVKVALSLI